MKPRVYMVCDHADDKARSMNSAPNIGVEYMGNCSGRILNEDGSEIGRHSSSSFGWLRADLINKLDDKNNYEVIDLIGQKVPEQFSISI